MATKLKEPMEHEVDVTNPTGDEMVGSLAGQIAQLTAQLTAVQIKLQKTQAELGARNRKITNLENQIANLKAKE